MADTIEMLALGVQNGWSWAVDHDETAGTIGVTVTDSGSPEAGNLLLNAQVVQVQAGGTSSIVGTVAPIRIDGFDNDGRQVLYTNAALQGMTLTVPKGATPPFYALNIWTTFTPAASLKASDAAAEPRSTVELSGQGARALMEAVRAKG